MRKKIIVTSVLTLLLTLSVSVKAGNRELEQYGVRVMQSNHTALSETLFRDSLERQRVAEEKEKIRLEALKREQELKLQEEELAKNKAEASKPTVNRGSQKITFYLSFYTSLPGENGGYSRMANGEPVNTAKNAVASNYYKLGTSITLEGYGTFTVKDRGGKSFNSPQRLDVLVLRKAGESDSEYKRRVLSMGRKTVTGWINN